MTTVDRFRFRYNTNENARRRAVMYNVKEIRTKTGRMRKYFWCAHHVRRLSVL